MGAVSLGVPESSTLVWVTRGRRLQEARTMSENASAIHTGLFNVTYEVEVRDEQATAVRNATQKIQKNHTDFEDLLGKQLSIASAGESAISDFRMCCFEEAVILAIPATSTPARASPLAPSSAGIAWDTVGGVGSGTVVVLVLALCVFRCCHHNVKDAAKGNTNDAMLEVSWTLEEALSDFQSVTKTPSGSNIQVNEITWSPCSSTANDAMLELSWALEAALSDHQSATHTPSSSNSQVTEITRSPCRSTYEDRNSLVAASGGCASRCILSL